MLLLMIFISDPDNPEKIYRLCAISMVDKNIAIGVFRNPQEDKSKA